MIAETYHIVCIVAFVVIYGLAENNALNFLIIKFICVCCAYELKRRIDGLTQRIVYIMRGCVFWFVNNIIIMVSRDESQMELILAKLQVVVVMCLENTFKVKVNTRKLKTKVIPQFPLGYRYEN